MTTRDEVRELEAKVKTLAADRPTQIAILTHAQGMARNDERALALLALVKRRIIRKSQ